MSIEELESRMVTYSNSMSVPVIENQEPLVIIDKGVIPNGYLPTMADMIPLLQDKIPVRITVYDKLKQAQTALKEQYGDLSLFVSYGYRSLEVQTRKFLDQLRLITAENRFFPNPVDLYEEASRFIAVPTVAGHPTGGAVDLFIINQTDGKSLDFGSEMYDFSNKDCYTFASVSEVGKNNRALLRSVMLGVGFAPYDGEWWHFCFGDREWAYYYKQPNAIYEQLPERKVKEMVT